MGTSVWKMWKSNSKGFEETCKENERERWIFMKKGHIAD